MNCPNCQAATTSADVFCSDCGAAVTAVSNAPVTVVREPIPEPSSPISLQVRTMVPPAPVAPREQSQFDLPSAAAAAQAPAAPQSPPSQAPPTYSVPVSDVGRTDAPRATPPRAEEEPTYVGAPKALKKRTLPLIIGAGLAVAVLIGFVVTSGGSSGPSTTPVLPKALVKEPASVWKKTIAGQINDIENSGSTTVVAAIEDGELTLTALDNGTGDKVWTSHPSKLNAVGINLQASGPDYLGFYTEQSPSNSTKQGHGIALISGKSGEVVWSTPTDEGFYPVDSAGLLSSYDGEATLARLDMGAKKVGRRVSSPSTLVSDSGILLQDAERVTLVDRTTLDKRPAKIDVGSKGRAIAWIDKTVFVARGNDLVGFDLQGKEMWSERLSVGAPNVVKSAGGSYLVGGSDKVALISVSGNKVDEKWAETGLFQSASSNGGHNFLYVVKSGNLISFEIGPKQATEVGRMKVQGSEGGIPVQFLSGGLYYSDGDRFVEYSLPNLEKGWSISNGDGSFRNVNDALYRLKYDSNPTTTTIELFR
jgi:hypothetical protein